MGAIRHELQDLIEKSFANKFKLFLVIDHQYNNDVKNQTLKFIIGFFPF